MLKKYFSNKYIYLWRKSRATTVLYVHKLLRSPHLNVLDENSLYMQNTKAKVFCMYFILAWAVKSKSDLNLFTSNDCVNLFCLLFCSFL